MEENKVHNDELLIQTLREFGEVVDKITDKNRVILEKKLNHLRARRRQSEKLSQSMLSPRSPVKKGRGKKITKVTKGATSTLAIDNNKSPAISSQPELMKDDVAAIVSLSPEKKLKLFYSVASAAISAGAQSNESQTTITKRSRKSAMPCVTNANEASGKESEKFVEVTTEVVSKTRRGRKTNKLIEKTEQSIQQSSVIEKMDPVLRRRTYSCEKSPTGSQNKESNYVSRIPKYGLGKVQNIASSTSPVELLESAQSETHQPLQCSVNHAVGDLPKVEPSFFFNLHIIDSVIGCAAANVSVTLSLQTLAKTWSTVAVSATDDAGRCDSLGSGHNFTKGVYRLYVQSDLYFQRTKQRCCYPFIDIVLNVDDLSSPMNIQLVLSAFGYSTSRIVNRTN